MEADTECSCAICTDTAMLEGYRPHSLSPACWCVELYERLYGLALTSGRAAYLNECTVSRQWEIYMYDDDMRHMLSAAEKYLDKVAP